MKIFVTPVAIDHNLVVTIEAPKDMFSTLSHLLSSSFPRSQLSSLSCGEQMVSDSSKKKGPPKKAAPAAKNGGKAVAAASSSKATAKKAVTAASSSKATAKKGDGVVKKAVQKSADALAKKAAQKKADAMAKRAAQKKADAVAKKAATAASKRVGKAVAAAASFKAAATVDAVAKKAAAAAAKRVGRAVAAAATVFDANGVYRLQMPDQTCTGVRRSHPLSRDIQAKANMREKEDNTERPGLVQCKYCLSWGDCTVGKACKCKHGRGKIPVAPITDYNFLGLPIRPGQKDCPYYMRNGSCKYESNCWFNHPDPTTMEGGDAPSLSGDGGSGPSQGAFQPAVFSWSPPSQGAFQPAVFSWSPPRTANDTVPFVPVVFSPTHMVPPPNVEWNCYQNTTIMETPLPHSSLTPVAVAPSPLASPTTTKSSPPASPTITTLSPPASPTASDGTPQTSPKLVEEEDHKLKSVNLRKCKLRLRKRKKVTSKNTRPGQATGAELLLQFIELCSDPQQSKRD
ncbi:hypothetical protein Vadar_018269 [Vaccinium darrowii]|uniref:Uncharacterized protein n=1 Tax=Vaccinium darrowii TaxID=229202 RepID=A0ACB7YNW8_9ERIC|nr:hypothetical protein Vadar_018269 [Vaccinium darrowii]